MTRNVGNAAEVVASFARYNDGGPNRTPAASVPGGRRLHYSHDMRGTVTLYSYRTEVAVRLADGRYAVTSVRYGPSTGKALGRLRRALAAAGMGPTGEYIMVDTAVPSQGRWGGYGPAWHPTGRESYPFAIYDVLGHDPSTGEPTPAQAYADRMSAARAEPARTRAARRAARLIARGEPMFYSEVADYPAEWCMSSPDAMGAHVPDGATCAECGAALPFDAGAAQEVRLGQAGYTIGMDS